MCYKWMDNMCQKFINMHVTKSQPSLTHMELA
jgi:hypothetical protein